MTAPDDGRMVIAEALAPYDLIDLDRSPDIWGLGLTGTHLIRETRRRGSQIVIVCAHSHTFPPVEPAAEVYVKDPQ